MKMGEELVPPPDWCRWPNGLLVFQFGTLQLRTGGGTEPVRPSGRFYFFETLGVISSSLAQVVK